MWFSYKSVFVKKVFPWTFGSEILLLLLIVLRSKLVFDKNLMSWISIISYIIVQFYTYHNIILIIPIENIISLIIYMVVYSKELFSNEKFLMNELKFFFPIYLVCFKFYVYIFISFKNIKLMFRFFYVYLLDIIYDY